MTRQAENRLRQKKTVRLRQKKSVPARDAGLSMMGTEQTRKDVVEQWYSLHSSGRAIAPPAMVGLAHFPEVGAGVAGGNCAQKSNTQHSTRNYTWLLSP